MDFLQQRHYSFHHNTPDPLSHCCNREELDGIYLEARPEKLFLAELNIQNPGCRFFCKKIFCHLYSPLIIFDDYNFSFSFKFHCSFYDFTLSFFNIYLIDRPHKFHIFFEQSSSSRRHISIDFLLNFFI